MESTQKQTWGGIMLIRTFVLKVINNERKILTHQEIIDRIAEQIESVIFQVCRGSKLWIHRTYGGQFFHLLIHLSSLTFLLYIYRP